MPKYRVTVPIYHTCVVEALDESRAFQVAWFEKEWSAWERDDPQPDTEEYDASIELEECAENPSNEKPT